MYPARTTPRTLAPALAATDVRGHGVPATTLGELLDGRLTLLVFLRHFG